ncbi:hypothetical protein LB565_00235 [Mesorhizobium sp. CA14]|uniref:hypothetical protein n=1 Tax=Mesorhizobium sp. CA14 TaxID=2876642 RepID=UPI001CCF2324|nr:hypothetical protein [Mesorhizobium sp. CA14]MBZ9846428.1 hypothetical protein [Mesorhizobium sp. CA14]
MTDKKDTSRNIQHVDVRKGYQPTKGNVQGGYKPTSGGGAPTKTPTTSSGGRKK